MPPKIQRSTLETISPNGYAILRAIQSLTPNKEEKTNPFSMASISAKKVEANIMTIERKLKASGVRVSAPIITEELNTLSNYGYINKIQDNLVGKANKLTYELTTKGLEELQRYSRKASPSCKQG